MTGEDIRQLLLNKWGVSYDIQLRRTRGKIFLQIMWKYLEQLSFPLDEADYIAHLNAIANHLNSWGSTETGKKSYSKYPGKTPFRKSREYSPRFRREIFGMDDRGVLASTLGRVGDHPTEALQSQN